MSDLPHTGGDMTSGPSRGRLHVWLSYAAGVGKTYTVLGVAHRLKERGQDVVVGFVEAHGRAATAALVDGIEVVARRRVPHRDTWFEEMDVDAVLARRPQVAVVDELAHTNVPGGRHDKRWQDVEDLLAAGITVLTTLNIQHLESLNDTVERDHRGGAAGDHPRCRGARRRPDRSRGCRPRATPPPPRPGRYLPTRAGRCRSGPLLPGGQSHRSSRTDPALARRPGG